MILKLSKSQLQKLIKEEMDNVLDEDWPRRKKYGEGSFEKVSEPGCRDIRDGKPFPGSRADRYCKLRKKLLDHLWEAYKLGKMLECGGDASSSYANIMWAYQKMYLCGKACPDHERRDEMMVRSRTGPDTCKGKRG